MFHPLLHTTAESLPRRSCTASCTSAAHVPISSAAPSPSFLNPSRNLPFPFPRYAQLHRFLRERCLHNRLTEDQSRWVFQQMIVGLDFCHRMVRRALVPLPIAAQWGWRFLMLLFPLCAAPIQSVCFVAPYCMAWPWLGQPRPEPVNLLLCQT